ncbi:NmrA family NAD(P)-binding protein [Amycolatopsis sp. NPDC051373]|uniref:NmrA family NAD(P)-binding protein n=1 Tax=Amycolatopsis sp. NPDC051373 TaxID=3155801 RepID=UPI00344F4D24
MSSDTVLVTGATGRHGGTGAHVVRRLLESGIPVRALVRRHDERAERVAALGAEVVVWRSERLPDPGAGAGRRGAGVPHLPGRRGNRPGGGELRGDGARNGRKPAHRRDVDGPVDAHASEPPWPGPVAVGGSAAVGRTGRDDPAHGRGVPRGRRSTRSSTTSTPTARGTRSSTGSARAAGTPRRSPCACW